jgi:DNA phosphorothioation-dependent restriction protein DptG
MVSTFLIRGSPKYFENKDFILILTCVLIGRAETGSYESLFEEWSSRRVSCCGSNIGDIAAGS